MLSFPLLYVDRVRSIHSILFYAFIYSYPRISRKIFTDDCELFAIDKYVRHLKRDHSLTTNQVRCQILNCNQLLETDGVT